MVRNIYFSSCCVKKPVDETGNCFLFPEREALDRKTDGIVVEGGYWNETA